MGDVSFFTDDADAVIIALETLYIPQNKGGRVQFIKAYPDVARDIFGDALYELDTEGRGDRTQLAAIEHQAEERRLALVDFITHLKSGKDIDPALVQDTDFLRGTNTLRLIFTDEAIAIMAHNARPTESTNAKKSTRDENIEDKPHDKDETPSASQNTTINISKALKDGKDIGKDILSDLQLVAEDYTPLVKKALGGIKDKIQSTAQTYADKKKTINPPKKDRTQTPVPPPVTHKEAKPKEKTPEVFLKPPAKIKRKPKKSVKSWHDFVAESQKFQSDQPADKAPAQPIRGAIDHEYDTNDYAYLYSSDGYEQAQKHPAPPTPKRSQPPTAPSAPVNPNMITNHSWGGFSPAAEHKNANVIQSGLQNTQQPKLGETFTPLPPHNATHEKPPST